MIIIKIKILNNKVTHVRCGQGLTSNCCSLYSSLELAAAVGQLAKKLVAY